METGTDVEQHPCEAKTGCDVIGSDIISDTVTRYVTSSDGSSSYEVIHLCIWTFRHAALGVEKFKFNFFLSRKFDGNSCYDCLQYINSPDAAVPTTAE